MERENQYSHGYNVNETKEIQINTRYSLQKNMVDFDVLLLVVFLIFLIYVYVFLRGDYTRCPVDGSKELPFYLSHLQSYSVFFL